MQIQKSFKKEAACQGTLFLVPTPIGNLEDISIRAVRTLKEVDLIASEDTRNTQKLLNHFEIGTPQISLHEHNYKDRISQLLEKLLEGKAIAQVSDAGMPSISDPGHEFVVAAIEAEIAVVSLPGPTAGLTALIASGLAVQPFLFYGFLERKKSLIKKELVGLETKKETLIFYESPYRLAATLQLMYDVWGDRPAVLCRELTKIYEEYRRGTLSELIKNIEENPVKGECCLLVAGNDDSEMFDPAQDFSNLALKDHVEQLVETENLSTKEAIKKVAQLRQIKKQIVYKEFHEI